jgi:N-acyl-D-aspartate/D-glutamate deacylase
MTAALDLLVRGGLVVDGTGLARRRVDIGVRDGRVVAVGHLDAGAAREVLDADGRIVAPGIVDAHTHYDPQITFDPYATVSCFHGVTTVVAGNCGFSVAPCKAEDRAFLAGIFARVENMDPIALGAITWDEFETFPEFLASRTGRLGVNLACYIGHSNVRRWVMGPDASARAATEPEIDAMRAVVRGAMEAGAAGVSSSAAPTHFDLEDRPVPSRVSDRGELAALVEEAGRHAGGSIAFLPASAIGGLNAEDEDYLIRLGTVSGLPVIIQGLGGRNKVDAPTATWEAAKAFLDRAAAAGAPVYSMLIARPFDRPITIDETNFHYLAVPSWDEMLKLPKDARLARLRDPTARATLRDAVEHYNRDPSQGTTVPPPLWDAVFVDETTPAHRAVQGRSIRELADERGVAPADVMLDLALDEDLTTRFRWRTESPEWAAAVGEAQLDARMIVGTSDGGAHLARDDGADWSSYFLRSWVLDRHVWTLEDGIRQITQVPAALIGLTDRGVIRPGAWADLMVFDPDTVGPWRKEFVHDLPGGVGRFKAFGRGVHATVVNGVPIVRDGELTGALPGRVVRPGRS